MEISAIWTLATSAAVVIVAVSAARMNSRIESLEEQLGIAVQIIRRLNSRDTYGSRK
jgi:hypothetical protein